MKEKNMWKELLNRAGWILVFLLAVLLYQVPLVVIYFDFKRSSPATVRADSYWYFYCGSGAIYYWSS